MERSMEQFGDQMFIKHAPMVQQEGMMSIVIDSATQIADLI